MQRERIGRQSSPEAPGVALDRWVAALRMPIAVIGWIVLLALSLRVAGLDLVDARTYYTVDLSDAYASSTLNEGGFVYSPAFALVAQPLQGLSFEIFARLILIGSAVALGFMVTPWMAALLVLVQAPGVSGELAVGNIDLVIGALLVLVWRRPWLWSAILLTKVTPGVGLVWYATRREWRPLALATVATLVVVLISLPFTAQAWPEWFGVLTGQNVRVADAQVMIPFAARALLGIGIVAFAGSTDRLWLIPIAAAISVPIPNAPHWTMALASIRLYRANGHPPANEQ